MDFINKLLILLVISGSSAFTNLDCGGKAFLCVNSTHFHVCVDFGKGISYTVDNFIIPCPPGTECSGKNHFECEIPTRTTTPATHTTNYLTNDVKAKEERGVSTTPMWEVVTTIGSIASVNDTEHSDKYLNAGNQSSLPNSAIVGPLNSVTAVQPGTAVTEITNKSVLHSVHSTSANSDFPLNNAVAAGPDSPPPILPNDTGPHEYTMTSATTTENISSTVRTLLHGHTTNKYIPNEIGENLYHSTILPLLETVTQSDKSVNETITDQQPDFVALKLSTDNAFFYDHLSDHTIVNAHNKTIEDTRIGTEVATEETNPHITNFTENTIKATAQSRAISTASPNNSTFQDIVSYTESGSEASIQDTKESTVRYSEATGQHVTGSTERVNEGLIQDNEDITRRATKTSIRNNSSTSKATIKDSMSSLENVSKASVKVIMSSTDIASEATVQDAISSTDSATKANVQDPMSSTDSASETTNDTISVTESTIAPLSMVTIQDAMITTESPRATIHTPTISVDSATQYPTRDSMHFNTEWKSFNSTSKVTSPSNGSILITFTPPNSSQPMELGILAVDSLVTNASSNSSGLSGSESTTLPVPTIATLMPQQHIIVNTSTSKVTNFNPDGTTENYKSGGDFMNKKGFERKSSTQNIDDTTQIAKTSEKDSIFETPDLETSKEPPPQANTETVSIGGNSLQNSLANIVFSDGTKNRDNNNNLNNNSVLHNIDDEVTRIVDNHLDLVPEVANILKNTYVVTQAETTQNEANTYGYDSMKSHSETIIPQYQESATIQNTISSFTETTSNVRTQNTDFRDILSESPNVRLNMVIGDEKSTLIKISPVTTDTLQRIDDMIAHSNLTRQGSNEQGVGNHDQSAITEASGYDLVIEKGLDLGHINNNTRKDLPNAGAITIPIGTKPLKLSTSHHANIQPEDTSLVTNLNEATVSIEPIVEVTADSIVISNTDSVSTAEKGKDVSTREKLNDNSLIVSNTSAYITNFTTDELDANKPGMVLLSDEPREIRQTEVKHNHFSGADSSLYDSKTTNQEQSSLPEKVKIPISVSNIDTFITSQIVVPISTHPSIEATTSAATTEEHKVITVSVFTSNGDTAVTPSMLSKVATDNSYSNRDMSFTSAGSKTINPAVKNATRNEENMTQIIDELFYTKPSIDVTTMTTKPMHDTPVTETYTTAHSGSIPVTELTPIELSPSTSPSSFKEVISAEVYSTTETIASGRSLENLTSKAIMENEYEPITSAKSSLSSFEMNLARPSASGDVPVKGDFIETVLESLMPQVLRENISKIADRKSEQGDDMTLSSPLEVTEALETSKSNQLYSVNYAEQASTTGSLVTTSESSVLQIIVTNKTLKNYEISTQYENNVLTDTSSPVAATETTMTTFVRKNLNLNPTTSSNAFPSINISATTSESPITQQNVGTHPTQIIAPYDKTLRVEETTIQQDNKATIATMSLSEATSMSLAIPNAIFERDDSIKSIGTTSEKSPSQIIMENNQIKSLVTSDKIVKDSKLTSQQDDKLVTASPKVGNDTYTSTTVPFAVTSMPYEDNLDISSTLTTANVSTDMLTSTISESPVLQRTVASYPIQNMNSLTTQQGDNRVTQSFTTIMEPLEVTSPMPNEVDLGDIPPSINEYVSTTESIAKPRLTTSEDNVALENKKPGIITSTIQQSKKVLTATTTTSSSLVTEALKADPATYTTSSLHVDVGQVSSKNIGATLVSSEGLTTRRSIEIPATISKFSNSTISGGAMIESNPSKISAKVPSPETTTTHFFYNKETSTHPTVGPIDTQKAAIVPTTPRTFSNKENWLPIAHTTVPPPKEIFERTITQNTSPINEHTSILQSAIETNTSVNPIKEENSIVNTTGYGLVESVLKQFLFSPAPEKRKTGETGPSILTAKTISGTSTDKPKSEKEIQRYYEQNFAQKFTADHWKAERTTFHPIPVKTTVEAVRPTYTANSNKGIQEPQLTRIAGTTTAKPKIIRPRTPIPNFNCTNLPRGRYSDENDCRKFYICVGKLYPIVGHCPDNAIFSEGKRQCVKNLSHCIRGNEFKCAAHGRFVDYKRSDIYYLCIRSANIYLRFKFQCKNGYILDRITVRCKPNVEEPESDSISDSVKDTDKSNLRLVSSSSSSSKKSSNDHSGDDEFICRKIGRFPDPSDSRKFYICYRTKKSDLKMKVGKCDSDEVFNPDKKKCVDNESYE